MLLLFLCNFAQVIVLALFALVCIVAVLAVLAGLGCLAEKYPLTFCVVLFTLIAAVAASIMTVCP